jgi:hypothetical protein
MVIDERELLYPPDSPLRAWRLFRVRADDADIVLSSPMYHDPDPPPCRTRRDRTHRAARLVLAGPSGARHREADAPPPLRRPGQRPRQRPDWVTGNQRDAGRPPDEVDLDLYLGRLDLR